MVNRRADLHQFGLANLAEVPLAHWIVRVGIIVILTPPPGDLRAALDALLLPALEVHRKGPKS